MKVYIVACPKCLEVARRGPTSDEVQHGDVDDAYVSWIDCTQCSEGIAERYEGQSPLDYWWRNRRFAKYTSGGPEGMRFDIGTERVVVNVEYDD